MALLDPVLQQVLVCPQCKGALQEDEPNAQLICNHCHLAFRVEDGIPIMLVEEAKKLEPSAA